MNHDYNRNLWPRITDVEHEAPVSSPVNKHMKGSMGVLLTKRRELVINWPTGDPHLVLCCCGKFKGTGAANIPILLYSAGLAKLGSMQEYVWQRDLHKINLRTATQGVTSKV